MHRTQSLLQHAVAMHYSGAAALTQPQTRTTTPLHSSSTATLSPAGQKRLDSSSKATQSSVWESEELTVELPGEGRN